MFPKDPIILRKKIELIIYSLLNYLENPKNHSFSSNASSDVSRLYYMFMFNNQSEEKILNLIPGAVSHLLSSIRVISIRFYEPQNYRTGSSVLLEVGPGIEWKQINKFVTENFKFEKQNTI